MAECREAMSLAWVRDETVLVLDVVEILVGATGGVGEFGLVLLQAFLKDFVKLLLV